MGTEIFGWKNATDITGRKKRVDPRFHRWLCHVLSLEGDKLILVPRLHLKTTWVKARIVQRILQNPNIRIGLFSVTSRLVEQELRDIKRLFCTPALMELFPDLIPPPSKDYRNWEKSTANELTVKRYYDDKNNKAPQEPQITALGSLAGITGMHLDEAYPDDIIDKDSVTTAEQMNKSEAWWGYIQSVLELHATVTMTGTFYHYNDLYNTIIRSNHFPKNRIFIRKAIEDNQLLYKSWFTFKDLEKKKKIQGNYIFNCQYMLNPIPQEDQIFPGPQPTYTTLPDDKNGYTYFITVDPSLGKEHSDDIGIVIAALNSKKTIYVVEAMGVKKKGNDLADLLINKIVQYKPLKVGIEFGLQGHLRYIIESRRSAYEEVSGKYLPMLIEGIPIPRGYSKGSRIAWTLGSFVRQRRFWIHESCRDLIAEMDTFTGKGKEKDNIVDAAAMLFYLIDSFHYTREEDNKFKKSSWWNYFFKKEDENSWRSNFVK